jgi:hypothetical protein
VADRQAELVAGGAQALVVAGLAGQVGEQVPEPVAGEPQPVAFGAGAEQDLGEGQADQLGVGELGRSSWSQAGAEQVVDGDVQCGDEVVEVGAHETSWVDGAVATPIFGDLVLLVTATNLVRIRNQPSSLQSPWWAARSGVKIGRVAR